MEDDLKKKMEDDLKIKNEWKTTSKKIRMEDDLKHNLKNQP